MTNTEQITEKQTIIYAYISDFWVAFLEKPKFIRWLCLLLMGRYAKNELIGTKETLDKYDGDIMDRPYGLKNCDYHDELDHFKNW